MTDRSPGSERRFHMYIADKNRYGSMKYNRCGKSGLLLPAVSLGLWHNFGDTGVYTNMEKLLFTAFDLFHCRTSNPGVVDKKISARAAFSFTKALLPAPMNSG